MINDSIKRLKKMTQKERDDELQRLLDELYDMQERIIKQNIKHLEKNGYKVTKL